MERAKDIHARLEKLIGDMKGDVFKRKIKGYPFRVEYTKSELETALLEVDLVIESIEWILSQGDDADRYFLYWI